MVKSTEIKCVICGIKFRGRNCKTCSEYCARELTMLNNRKRQERWRNKRIAAYRALKQLGIEV